jgi:hypothetical protein
MAIEDRWLSVEEICKYLGVSLAVLVGACVAIYAIRSVFRGAWNKAETPVEPPEP